MQFTINAADLLEGLNTVTRALCKRQASKSKTLMLIEEILAEAESDLDAIDRCVEEVFETVEPSGTALVRKISRARAYMRQWLSRASLRFSIKLRALTDKRRRLTSRIDNGDSLYMAEAAMPIPPTMILNEGGVL